MPAAKQTAAAVVQLPPAARFATKKDRHAGLVATAARRRKYHRDERIDGIIREAYRRAERPVRATDRQGAGGAWDCVSPAGLETGGSMGLRANRSGARADLVKGR